MELYLLPWKSVEASMEVGLVPWNLVGASIEVNVSRFTPVEVGGSFHGSRWKLVEDSVAVDRTFNCW